MYWHMVKIILDGKELKFDWLKSINVNLCNVKVGDQEGDLKGEFKELKVSDMKLNGKKIRLEDITELLKSGKVIVNDQEVNLLELAGLFKSVKVTLDVEI